MSKLGFIGGGRMAEALIARLGNAKNIIVFDVDRKRLSYLRNKYGVRIATDNFDVVTQAGIVILAVKPQNMAEVLGPKGLWAYRPLGNKLFISIVAGIPLTYLQQKLPKAKIIRAMPNTPCLVGEGMICLAKGKGTAPALMNKALKIFQKVGEVLEVPEKWLDAVTGLSGSGPAYVFEVIEALTNGGVKNGLPRAIAAKLALQTVYGAAATVKQTGHEPLALCQMVTSPGGTTIEGLKVLSKKKTAAAISEAVTAAAKKSKELSNKWTL
ncbi:MAG: pyrroline-5-carboxylate reductase [bacterium]